MNLIFQTGIPGTHRSRSASVRRSLTSFSK
jgi:hypothetical protein